jgi:murein tripeptide amidase MpaA
VSHDDHFHCFAFPSGITAGTNGSAVRTDTWKRGLKKPKKGPAPKPDLEFYSLTADLDALVARQNKQLANSAKVESLGKAAGGTRDLLVLKLGKDIDKDPGKKPRVLFTGGLHAREWLGVTYTYLIAEWLVTHFPAGATKDPLELIAKDLLENNHVWFVPMCNPDGHEYTVTIDRFHRKNSPGGDSHFLSAPGGKAKRDASAPDSTDLNRNFDTKQWKTVRASKKGSFSTNVNDETFLGTNPADTAEVQVLQKMITSTTFDLAVDHHTFDCALLFPLGDTVAKAQEDTRIVAFTKAMQTQINRKAQASTNFTTQKVADVWSMSKTSDFYATLRKFKPGDRSRVPGSITDFIIYTAQDAKRKTVAFAMELPPMHHTDSPGFNPDESIILPAFRQLIGTSLALIKNAAAATVDDTKFSPFDVVAP